MSVLHLPYESGGLKLPNFYYYFLSSQLTQFKQWFMNTSCSWKRIESFDMYPYSLEHLPYIEFKEVDKITKNPVFLYSLSICKLSHKLLGYKISLSPCSPIWMNPSITCCVDDTFKLWYDEGVQEFCHLFDNGTMGHSFK